MIKNNNLKSIYNRWVRHTFDVAAWPRMLITPNGMVSLRKTNVKNTKFADASFLRSDNDISPNNKSIYIHIPFCYSICSFCNFNRVVKNKKQVDNYIKAVKDEMRLYAETKYIGASKFDAIYFGGGTPTCLSTSELISLIKSCRDNFTISKDVEITVEGCPVNFDNIKLQKLRKAGVNRLSLGVQTFNDRISKFLDVPQSPSSVCDRIKTAHKIGYDNINIDLMYDLPEQKLDDWRSDLRKSIELKVESISCLPLRVLPRTKLAKNCLSGEISFFHEPDIAIDMYEMAIKEFQNAGYDHMKIDTFYLPKKNCKYGEMHYSGIHTVVGLGASAEGLINRIDYRNDRSIESYIKMVSAGHLPYGVAIKLSEEDEKRKFIVGSLKFVKLDKNIFYDRYKEHPENKFSEIINSLASNGLIKVNSQEISLTHKGKIWGNNVCREFVPEYDRELLEKEERSFEQEYPGLRF